MEGEEDSADLVSEAERCVIYVLNTSVAIGLHEKKVNRNLIPSLMPVTHVPMNDPSLTWSPSLWTICNKSYIHMLYFSIVLQQNVKGEFHHDSAWVA
jgi:hypothetical protein